MLWWHVLHDGRISIRIHPFVDCYSDEVHPDFHGLSIVHYLGFLTYILVRYAIKVVLIYLKVIG